MGNPIPYNQLFDIDGLNLAIKDAEASSNQFGTAVKEDFKRSQAAAASLRKELEKLNAILQKPIKLTDESAQQKVVELAREVANLSAQYKAQQAAIENMNKVLQGNKAAMSDVKLQAEQYRTELAKGKVVTQDLKNAVAQLTLEQKQHALAVRQAAAAQVAATGSYKEAQQKLTALGNAIKNTKDGFNSTSPALKSQIADYNQLNDKLKAFDATMGNHQRSVGNYKLGLEGMLSSLENFALGLVSITAAMELAKKTFETALETDANRSALQYILNSVEQADIKMDMLKKTAENLGLEFTSLAKSYNFFMGAAKSNNFDMADADKVFYAVAHAAGIMHLSADQTHNAMYALSEMIGKGTIQAKELQRQLGIAIPQASAAMAEALGVSTQQLREMERSGSIISSETLPKFADALNNMVGKGVVKIESLQASWNRFKNVFSESIDENSNIRTFFSWFLDKLTLTELVISNLVNSTSWKSFFLKGTGATGFIAGITEDALNRNNPTKNAFDKFYNAPRKEQQSQIATQTTIRDRAYEQAGSGKKDDIAYYNAMQASLDKLRKTYDDLYPVKRKFETISDENLKSIQQIRQRITELDKLPGSATKGDPVNDRIDALKKRLHDLSGTVKASKDGLKLLNEQLEKILETYQDAIIVDNKSNNGVATKRTLELADAYTKVFNQIKAVKEAQKQFDADAQSRFDFANRGKAPQVTNNATKISNSEIAAGLSTAMQPSVIKEQISKTISALSELENETFKSNKAILESYKNKKIGILQYDAEIEDSAIKSADKQYQLNSHLLDLQIELNKLEGKDYENLLKQKNALDEKYDNGQITKIKRQYELQQKLIDQTVELINTSAKTVGEATNSPGLGRLISSVGTTLAKATTLKIDPKTGKPGTEMTGIPKEDAIQTAAAIAMGAIGTYTDFAINASKQRQAALEQEMQYEIAGAGTNAKAKQAIEYEYSRRIKAEKQKQAKITREAAAIEIVINTALAVSKVAAQTGVVSPFLIPAIIALGAIQEAIVLSQPIPQYEKGRSGGKDEVALVNERGPELIGKGGSYRIANRGKRGLAHLRDGESVITAHQTENLFINRQIAYSGQSAEDVGKSKAIYDMYVMSHTSKNDIDYNEIGNQMSGAIQKLPFQVTTFDEKGISNYTQSQNSRIKSVRSRNQF
jgi:tape measure domain-containing protein